MYFSVKIVGMKFSEKLEMLIEMRDTTQGKIGVLTGLARTAVSDMTAGKRRPYLDQGFRLAKALGVPLEFLADDELEEIPGPQLSDDEQYMLRVIRDSGLSSTELVAMISGRKLPLRVLAVQDHDESDFKRARERNRPSSVEPNSQHEDTRTKDNPTRKR